MKFWTLNVFSEKNKLHMIQNKKAYIGLGLSGEIPDKNISIIQGDIIKQEHVVIAHHFNLVILIIIKKKVILLCCTKTK